jgi:hypothetical protein
MAALTTDHLCLWFGTNASIPAGWTPYAPANDRAIQGAESSIATQSGADTHTHTDAGHGLNFVGLAHTHDVDAEYFDTGAFLRGVNGPALTAFATYKSTVPTGHHHAAIASSAPATPPYATGTLSIVAANHLPPSVTCILIHPTTGTLDVPDGASVFLDDGAGLSGYTWHDGVGAAIDLTDKFVNGVADAATDDGGGATGQATHTHTTNSHTHPGQSHTHPSFTCGDATTSGSDNTGGVVDALSPAHHDVSLAATTPATSGGASPSSDATTVEPPYVKLMAAQNTSGGDNSQPGMICLYKGASPGSVTDWTLCDGTGGTADCDGKFIKVTNTAGDIGDTGGSSTHQHASEFSHEHTLSAHTHTVITDLDHAAKPFASGVFLRFSRHGGHVFADHVWNCTSDVPGQNPSTVTTSFDSHLPKSVTLAFLKYAPPGRDVVSRGGYYNPSEPRVILAG